MKRAIFLVLLLGSSLPGATYYVASYAPAGGDGSSTNPFNTLAAVGAVLDHNDVVRLWQGSIFREDFYYPNIDGVTFTGWGDGSLPMPQIWGDIPLSAGVWEPNETYTNVYQYSRTQSQTEAYVTVFEDGTQLSHMETLADVNDTPGTYHIDGTLDAHNMTKPGPITVYLHPGDSDNPNTNGKSYSIADPNRHGIVWLGDDSTIEYIVAGRQSSQTGAIHANSRSLISHCVSIQGSKHEFLLSSGEYRDCIAWHPVGDSRTQNITMEFFIPDGTGLDCLYNRCIVIGPGETGLLSTTGFGGHNSGAGTYYESWEARDCLAVSCVNGFSLTANAVNLLRCKAVNCCNGFYLVSVDTPGNVTDCYCHFDAEHWPNQPETDMYLTRFGETDGAIIRGLRIYNSGNNIAMVYLSKDVFVQRSVFVVDDIATGKWPNIIRPSFNSLAAPTVEGNIVVNLDETADRARYIFGEATNMDPNWYADNNVIWPESMNNRILDTGYANLTDYFAAVRAMDPNREVNSLCLDPNLADPANGDFHVLNPTVAAMDVGLERPDIEYLETPDVNDLLLFDWDGNANFYEPMNYPDEEDVRSGTYYGGESGTLYIGRLRLPDSDEVLAGTQYGANGTEYTGTLEPGADGGASAESAGWIKRQTGLEGWRKR
jgi:hypothetical protein